MYCTVASIVRRVQGEQVARMVVVYETEWTIGAREAREPASIEIVAAGCEFMQGWLGRE